MLFEDSKIPAVKIIKPKIHGDERGFFSEVYKKSDWVRAGLEYDFVQENHSLSVLAWTLRGLHFQTPPFAQDKLMRVISGRILDVAVDIRRSSPTFGQHVAVELSAENWRQVFIPIGFAHGFITLEPNTQVTYMVTAPYAPAHDRGLAFDDPDIDIKWPAVSNAFTLSEKDRHWPCLRDLEECFV
jgi:dTDP-4-dehydrorhamnose 3,5-epimerase